MLQLGTDLHMHQANREPSLWQHAWTGGLPWAMEVEKKKLALRSAQSEAQNALTGMNEVPDKTLEACWRSC